MITADVQHPRDLSPADIAAWRDYVRAEPAFHSPLLGPDFARLVGEVREDARVAMFRRQGRTSGALAFHKRSGGFAQPIGACFSDYQALVSAPGEQIDGEEALAAAGIGSIRFGALIDPSGSFPQAGPADYRGHVIELNGSAADHDAALRAANSKRHKNWRRLQGRLEREIGEITLEPRSDDQDAFDQLIAWKRDQFRRTGTHDVLRPQWARALFQTLFQRSCGEVFGVMAVMRAGGRVVAGKFGVVADGYWHTWISSMDPDCAACAPGLVMMLREPEIMEAIGVHTHDMGPGYAHYKGHFASREVSIGEILATADGAAGVAGRSLQTAWALAGDGRIEAVGRLRRRLDTINAAELSVGGRVRGFADAITGYSRRASSREPVQADAVVQES